VFRISSVGDFYGLNSLHSSPFLPFPGGKIEQVSLSIRLFLLAGGRAKERAWGEQNIRRGGEGMSKKAGGGGGGKKKAPVAGEIPKHFTEPFSLKKGKKKFNFLGL